jgi:hypothetical protein
MHGRYGQEEASGERASVLRVADARCDDVRVTLPFAVSDAVLIGTQAALVALPHADPPQFVQRLARRGWALVPAASIAIVVGAIALAPGTADLLTWLALVATPLLAAFALGYVVPGARPAWAVAVPVLFLIAWQAEPDTLVRDAAALSLTALGCLTIGWLLAAAAPLRWLKAGIYVCAIVDSVLVFSHQLQGPNATLNAAAPAAQLPKLQFVSFSGASMGYGDLFVAAVLGGILLLERRPQLPVAFACLIFAGLFDLLFFVTDELPATVPVAAALVASELLYGRSRRALGPARAAATQTTHL